MIKFFSNWLGFANSYSSEIERYIKSHNPKNTYDVEQLTRQFEQTISRGKIL